MNNATLAMCPGNSYIANKIRPQSSSFLLYFLEPSRIDIEFKFRFQSYDDVKLRPPTTDVNYKLSKLQNFRVRRPYRNIQPRNGGPKHTSGG